MMVRIAVLVTLLLLAPLPSDAQFGGLLEGLKDLVPGPQGGLTDDKIASGLKEALQIGTGNTVNLTGRPDGFLKNEMIKILMPEKLQSMDKALRLAGYGPQLDEFVVSMNRAAERAAPQAQAIFGDAITNMTFTDVKQVLNGGDTAATDYFKQKTSARLQTAFRPIVESSMNEVGVTRQYKELGGRFSAIPFVKMDAFDLDQHVVGKSLDGLFSVLAQEEKKIRTNPAARVTDLLKEVFAK